MRTRTSGWLAGAEVTLLMAALPMALRLIPWRRLARFALSNCARADVAEHLRWVERVAARSGWRAWSGCLPRALLRCRYLRALGVPAVLHVGLRRRAMRWEGHAWVTVEGELYAERPPADPFVAMWSSERAGG
jgi:hypothetical protein